MWIQHASATTLVLSRATWLLGVFLCVLLAHSGAALSRGRSLHNLSLMRRWHGGSRIRIILMRMLSTMWWRVLISGRLVRTADTWLMTAHAERGWHAAIVAGGWVAWRIAMGLGHHPLTSWRMHVHVTWRILILWTTVRHSLRHHAWVAIRLLILLAMTRIDRWLRTRGRLFFDETHLVEHLGYLVSSLSTTWMLSWIKLAAHLLRWSLVCTLGSGPGSHCVGVFLLVFLILLYRILHLFLIILIL